MLYQLWYPRRLLDPVRVKLPFWERIMATSTGSSNDSNSLPSHYHVVYA